MGGGDLDASEVEWFRACGRGRDYHLGRDVIDRYHERWSHGDAVWRQEVMHSPSDRAQPFFIRGEQCRFHCGPSVCTCGLVLGIFVTVSITLRSFSNAEVLHGHPRVCLRMLSFRPQSRDDSWDWRVRSNKK